MFSLTVPVSLKANDDRLRVAVRDRLAGRSVSTAEALPLPPSSTEPPAGMVDGPAALGGGELRRATVPPAA